MRGVRPRLGQSLAPYLFVGPAMVLIGALMVYPIGTVLYYSMLENAVIEPDSDWVGLRHFRDLFAEDRVFRGAIGTTMVFTVASVALHVFFGLLLALTLNAHVNPRVRSVFRTLLILPWIFTATIVAVNWRLILNPLGIVNFFLRSIGVIEHHLEWFSDPGRALPALILVNLWAGYPFVMVSLLAGLQGIPQVLYEAATVDGANRRQRFLLITLPQLAPVLLSISLLDFIWTFRLFPLIWLTTAGGPGRATQTLSVYAYKLAFSRFEYSQASSVAVIILLVTLGVSWFYVRRQRIVAN